MPPLPLRDAACPSRTCWRSVTLIVRSFSLSSAISALRALDVSPAPTAPTSATDWVMPTTSMPKGVTQRVLPSMTCCRAFCSSSTRMALRLVMAFSSSSKRNALTRASSSLSSA
jgi:hypothetical protein